MSIFREYTKHIGAISHLQFQHFIPSNLFQVFYMFDDTVTNIRLESIFHFRMLK